jgi:hypothetical protein
MSGKDELYNWLIMAFSISFGQFPEVFYYDVRDGVFYAIHLGDYMLLNEDLSVDGFHTSAYPLATLQLLSDRIGRIEKMDPDIIGLPSLPVADRKEIMQAFVDQQEDAALVQILQQRVINQDGSQYFDFYFGDEATAAVQTAWWNHKRQCMIPLLDEFLALHHIDLETASIWDIEEERSLK